MFSSPAGNTYAGQFLEDERHGFGVALMPDGTRLEGRWERGAFAPPRAGADGLEKQERKKARAAADRARRLRKGAYEQRALAIQARAAAEEYAIEQGLRETKDEFGSGTFNPQTHEIVEKKDLDAINAKLDQLQLAERRRIAKAALAKKQVDFETLQTQRGAIEAVADAHHAMREVAAQIALAKQGVITEELTDIANHKISVRLRMQQLQLVHAVKRLSAAEQECDILQLRIDRIQASIAPEIRKAIRQRVKHIPGGKVRKTRAELFANVKDRRTGGEGGPKYVERKRTPMQVDPVAAMAEAAASGERQEGGTMWKVLHGEFDVVDVGVYSEDDYKGSDYHGSSRTGGSSRQGGSRRGSRDDVPTMMLPDTAPNPPSPVKRRRGWGFGGGKKGRR